MSSLQRGVRGVAASTPDLAASHADDGGDAHPLSTSFAVVRKEPVVCLTFRDRLRIEYDGHLREAFVKLSSHFVRMPSNAWYGIRRHPVRAEHPWGRFLVLIDDAVREGAPEDTLLEVPALVTAYIHSRCAMRYPTPAEGAMRVPESERRIA